MVLCTYSKDSPGISHVQAHTRTHKQMHTHTPHTHPHMHTHIYTHTHTPAHTPTPQHNLSKHRQWPVPSDPAQVTPTHSEPCFARPRNEPGIPRCVPLPLSGVAVGREGAAPSCSVTSHVILSKM